MNARLDEAAARVAAADGRPKRDRAANQQIAALARMPSGKSPGAPDALEAGIVGNVLAAPDRAVHSRRHRPRAARLRAGAVEPIARARAERGAPAAPPTATVYQIWLLSNSGPQAPAP
jgi:hypothetical protein